ncbi:MAG: hypothetical protein Q9180_002409 [Flavoplaca navasiana]
MLFQGYAPGSWSQVNTLIRSFVCKRADGVNPSKVAVDRTRPNGLVLGIDVIPAQPPQGVSTIQGNFLSQTVQDEVKRFLRANWNRKHQHQSPSEEENEPWLAGSFGKTPRSYLERERQSEVLAPKTIHGRKTGIHGDGMVDVVLSDMSAPWEQTEGFWKRSLSDPYYRMMNTSGINFRDHAGSMDLCEAALKFAIDTLRMGGNFICKFYQGAEDKTLEAHLKTFFTKVYRDKPASSRSESKEAFFVALSRKKGTLSTEIFN